MNKEEMAEHKATIAKETARIAKKHGNRIVIANLYQLMRDDKTFSPDHKKLQQEKQPVEAQHVCQINDQWWQNGKLYIVDEEATEEWSENLKAHKAGLADKERIAMEAGAALTGALEGVKANTAAKVKAAAPAKVKEKEGVKANTAKHTHAVDAELKLIVLTKKIKESTKPEDFSFVGSEDECNAFIEEHKPE